MGHYRNYWRQNPSSILRMVVAQPFFRIYIFTKNAITCTQHANMISHLQKYTLKLHSFVTRGKSYKLEILSFREHLLNGLNAKWAKMKKCHWLLNWHRSLWEIRYRLMHTYSKGSFVPSHRKIYLLTRRHLLCNYLFLESWHPGPLLTLKNFKD